MTVSLAPSTTLDFRATMSRLPSGVSVITTKVGATPIGMTASSVTALSLEPLQLLVCVGNHLFTREAISNHGTFGVNILGQDSETLAKQFASARDRFAGVEYYEENDVPLLRDALASVICQVETEIVSGDHTIFVGNAVKFEHQAEGRPLIHCCGEFGRIA